MGLNDKFALANERAKKLQASVPRAVSAQYNPKSGLITVTLSSKLSLSFSPHDAQGLESATPSQLDEIEISPSGFGIHFPKLDADLYLPAILEGFLGSKRWMAFRLGQTGGKSRSAAKQTASRTNGRLGGRPRKDACASISSAQQTQREFFNILAEFFQRATGETAEAFASPEDFSGAVHRKGLGLARRAVEAYSWGYDSLIDFYNRNKTAAFVDARACSGIKLVFGGSSRFLGSQFNTFRKTALYADTILIPDPVLPWIEAGREEEKFRHVNLLQAVFHLLHLKPLVDADLAYPALVVFQSWEKSLERSDPHTRDGLNTFASTVLSHYLGKQFRNLEEIARYATGHEPEFLGTVQEKGLFIAPGAEGVQPIDKAIAGYVGTIKTWRSAKAVQQLVEGPQSQLVLNGILERVFPQWHLLENAEELRANPLFALKVHWHYHQLCTTVFNARLVEEHLLRSETLATIHALAEPRFNWLGNIPINALVELRREGENERFRQKLAGFTSALHESQLRDIDRVASEVGRGLASLLKEHQEEVRKIEAKYRSLHVGTAVKGWVTAAALFLPTLAPFLTPYIPVVTGAAAVGLAGKYAKDKIDQAKDLKQLSKSLTGVLASADDQL